MKATRPDSNLELVAELPEGLSFVDASGPTDSSNDGQTVTFEPVKELAAGARVEYRIRAKYEGGSDGNVTFTAKIKSDNREKAVQEEEPTTLFKAE